MRRKNATGLVGGSCGTTFFLRLPDERRRRSKRLRSCAVCSPRKSRDTASPWLRRSSAACRSRNGNCPGREAKAHGSGIRRACRPLGNRVESSRCGSIDLAATSRLVGGARGLRARARARRSRKLPILQGWRRAMAGEHLLQVMEGKLTVGYDPETGQVKLFER